MDLLYYRRAVNIVYFFSHCIFLFVFLNYKYYRYTIEGMQVIIIKIDDVKLIIQLN